MWQKFLSRKFLAAVGAFITVNVLPNLTSDQQARWSAAIAAAYVIGQGIADAFGSNPAPSQGDPLPTEAAPPTTYVKASGFEEA